jgi:4Fe-4S ferredoxin
LTLKLFVDTVQLRLDKVVCLKCDICARVCPREAVIIIPSDEGLDISIDPRLCLMCEICAHFCPVGAVTLSYNGQVKTLMADHQGLAPFLPKIDVVRAAVPCLSTQPEGEEHWCRQQLKLVPNDLIECPKQCHKCLAACPRQAIVLDEAASQTMPVPDLCLRCAHCLTVCEFGAILVNPSSGPQLLMISAAGLPVHRTVPVTIVREDERVFLKAENCAYCGVCVNICDEEAISLVREEVVAEAGEFSQAWTTAVEKLIR